MAAEDIERILSRACGRRLLRSLLDSDSAEAPALWAELSAARWPGLLVSEEHGGLGLSGTQAALVFEAMGRALAPGPFLSTAVLGAGAIELGGTAELHDRWLPSIAAGETVVTAAAIEEAAGVEAVRWTGRFVLSGRARFVPDALLADRIVVGARTGSGPAATLFLVDARAPGVRLEPHRTLDRTRRMATVVLEAVEALDEDRIGGEGEAASVAARIRPRALLASSAELLGIAQASLDIAVDYAKQREQFGRPIGSFQAMKHKLADLLVEIEMARALVESAAAALDERRDDAALATSAAKAFTSDLAVAVTSGLIQVYGGLGFTWDNDAHLFYRRAQATAALFGGGLAHRRIVGELLRGGV